MTKTEVKRQELARAIGESADSIAQASVIGLNALEQGVIVQVHVRRWRARTRLNFSDLGIPKQAQDEAYSHLLRLGDKKLLPQTTVNGRVTSYVDVLDALEGKGRRWLENHSFNSHWGRFVPATMYPEFKKGNEDIKAEYLGLRDDICKYYYEIVTALMKEYQEMAQMTLERTIALGTAVPDRRAFVDRFMNSIRALVPSKEYIYASFGYETELSFVPLPSDIERDIAKAQRIRNEQALATASDRAKIDAINEMQRDVIEQLKADKISMVDSFMTDVQTQIRSMVYETTTDVLDSIKRNDGKLVGKVAAQLSNLIETVNGLNFYGDRDIEAMMAKVKAQMGDTPKDRSVADIEATLKDIGTITRATLMSLGAEPRNGRGLGIDFDPTDTVIRQARRSIGIADDTDKVATRQAR